MKVFNTGEIIFNTYEVLELLNSGGMGNVYKVRHLKIPKIFAIKQLKLEQYKNLFIESFISEISILRLIKHPNISKFYDSLYFNNNFFYVMEFIEGEDIKTYFRKNNDLSEEKILKYFIMSLNAIDYLHSRSIIHRDIKPSNIMVDFQNDSVKIIDFGISNFLNNNIIFVSPGYSPPEQYQRLPPQPYNDIFSLGMTFLEIISNIKPFEQKSNFDKELHKNYLEKATEKSKEKISDIFLRVLLKCVELDPSKRFQTISEIISTLNKDNLKIDNAYLIEFNKYIEKVERISKNIEKIFQDTFAQNFMGYEIQKSVDMMIIKIFDTNEISIFFIFDKQELLIYLVPSLSKGYLVEKVDLENIDENNILAKVLELGGIV
ncbi:MAG: serine/threonine-protein kinase [Candidatus Calescibacterium sp.]|nr:serine/threonine protein kinase [Candidatus Calescibacterium sp.]MDW8133012.1 serine/threonine-protein kinase [Candidatus Calescibacterium sp.]